MTPVELAELKIQLQELLQSWDSFIKGSNGYRTKRIKVGKAEIQVVECDYWNEASGLLSSPVVPK
jgi:hypothetical protein